MIWNNPSFITRLDLGLAYRKAKVDLYYERDHCDPRMIVEYEENIDENLERLFKALHEDDLSWMSSPEVVGSWMVIPKKVDSGPKRSQHLSSDPDDNWLDQVNMNEEPPKAEFRLVGVHSMDLHIIGALWMLKVGHLYDAQLAENAFGSRLRRHQPDAEEEEQGQINEQSLGSFRPYLGPFQAWKTGGLTAIEKGLNLANGVIAITLDIRSFYHHVDYGFLLNEDYLKAIGLDTLTQDQRALTEALLNSFTAWNQMTGFGVEDNPTLGVPVGLPAARLVANLALCQLDIDVARELAPIFYGRYVDDIFLVIENSHDFSSDQSVLEFLAGRVQLLQLSDGKLEIKASYLSEGLKINHNKQKVFFLSGSKGKAMVQSVSDQIAEQSSEWKRMPILPDGASEMAAKLVKTISADGQSNANLRLVDDLTISRADLAFRVRDAEAYLQDLKLEAWQEQRRALLRVTAQHIVALPILFTMYPYLLRIFGIGVAGRDYKELGEILDRIEVVLAMVGNCKIELAGKDSLTEVQGRTVTYAWRRRLTRDLTNTVLSSVSSSHRRSEGELGKLMKAIARISGSKSSLNADSVKAWAERLFVHDLSRWAFRLRYFPYSKAFPLPIPANIPIIQSDAFVPERVQSGANSFHRRVRPGLRREPKQAPIAFVFPTRPFRPLEFYLLAPSVMTQNETSSVQEWLYAFRGFKSSAALPSAKRETGVTIIQVPGRNSNPSVRVTVTSFATEPDSWNAAVLRVPDPDRSRHSRFSDLLNHIIDAKSTPDYVVFPELSVPAHWFVRAALRLMSSGSSLVAGIEYLNVGRGRLGNEVWASLVSGCFGFPSVVFYRQAKIMPALHEEQSLEDLAGARLDVMRGAIRDKPVIEHGELRFGILICSEFTNIEHRCPFRGKVDALFVPEWNQDIELFSSIVESSAADIHAYIVQCNNRRYGDSRIRGPMKESWNRDIVRVRGGVDDYFVTGELLVHALREFQSRHRSPTGAKSLFKPVPEGFHISNDRRRLPRGDA